MQRIVQPEILDGLDPSDPVALANRRDLRLFNFLMGNFRWVARMLSQGSDNGNILEIGAGDGGLGLYLLKQGILTEGCSYTGVDLIAHPYHWPETWHWMKQDLRTISYDTSADTLITNMILHQFKEEDLEKVGKAITESNIKRLLICEPTRRRMHLHQVSLSRLLGTHRVTLHDASVSIEAGFRKDEVADKLGLDKMKWKISWSEHFLGANRVICERNEA